MLRETLWAYLRHGRSRLAASEELHIAPNTVAYRVHQADERLARAAAHDTTAMVVALSLASDFPALLA
jgi:DNA-binding PucR family transcriptional regulator